MAAGLFAPKNGVMKINEVSHYAGEEYGTEFAAKQVEDMLGVPVEYYARVDLASFKTLVDEMGGVWFDVPQRMIYDDPVQNLYIDVQPGYQLLNGTQAEGVARYRKSNSKGEKSPGYARGDLRRVEVQQDLLKAILSQAFAMDAKGLSALAKTALEHVRTNFPVTDLPRYVKYLGGIKAENIVSRTLPGAVEDGGRYYFIADGEKTADLAAEVFSREGGGGASAESSAGKDIRVLNGGLTEGMAAAWRDFLARKGYTVSSIGDYSGARRKNTRIVVPREGAGADLAALFDGASVETGETGGADILIIIGADEPKP
jgi:LCP family protein required for cell wall assembly